MAETLLTAGAERCTCCYECHLRQHQLRTFRKIKMIYIALFRWKYQLASLPLINLDLALCQGPNTYPQSAYFIPTQTDSFQRTKMASLPVLSYVVGAIGVAAHGAYIGSEGIPIYSTPKERPSCETAFEYHGCAVVDLNGFSDPINIPNERLTHETCQVACEGNQIVAIFAEYVRSLSAPDLLLTKSNSSCRCGNDPDAFEATDPSVCDNPCSGDPNLGMCGSQCPQNGKEISTIYIAIEKPPVDPIDGKALDPSISPTVAVNPLPIPDTTG